MFSYDAVLAAALLTSPPVALPASETTTWSDRLRVPLLALALEMEILDHREVSGIFQAAHDFGPDLSMLQSRFQSLLNAPLVEEAHRFPSPLLSKSFLALNRALRQECMDRLSFDRTHGEALQQAVAEIDHLHAVWDTVREAGSPCFYVTVRRTALARLRSLVGMEAYYRGQLPAHVPLRLLPVAR